MAETQQSSSERKAFKDYFDRAAAKALAAQMKSADDTFDEAKFVRAATRTLTKLEFNDRVKQFSNALADCLPEHRSVALKIVEKSLPEPLPDCESVTDGWLQWPVGQFIADHCIDDFAAAFRTMEALTQRFSSEFAVRPFVQQYQEKTLAQLLSLTTHKSPHVRRWCSEGSRTRLPWGMRLDALVADPSALWPILEALKDDDELYVRRSVANSLNDIAKDHPEQVIKRCKSWAKGASEDRLWVIKHGLRSLIKDGNPDALKVIGYGPPRKVAATLNATPARVAIGGSLEMKATLSSDYARKQKLMVDFVVHYVKKKGKSSAKTFKWTTTTLEANSTLELKKKLPLRVTTIRPLYAGVHLVELQVNGEQIAQCKFTLK